MTEQEINLEEKFDKLLELLKGHEAELISIKETIKDMSGRINNIERTLHCTKEEMYIKDAMEICKPQVRILPNDYPEDVTGITYRV